MHANAYAPAGWDYMTDRLQAARSMMATACRTTFCGHVHVPAVFHMARGGRPAEFTPVPSVGIPLVASRQWLAVVGAVGKNPATEIPLLPMRFCMTSRAR